MADPGTNSAVRLRLAKVDESQFLACLENDVWGASRNRLQDWQAGDFLAFIVGSGLAGLARVSGKPFTSNDLIFANGFYPYRVPLTFLHIITFGQRSHALAAIRPILVSHYGKGYGFPILLQLILLKDFRTIL